MPTEGANGFLRHIRKLAAEKASEPTDRDLVQRFVTRGEEAAFAALVHRHGPMVFRLCLRVLGNQHDAEDAFQAVFLVLSRKAISLQRTNSVSSWLFGVAQRISLKAKTAAARRHVHEARVASRQSMEPLDEITVREAQEVLDQELAYLPEKYRAALVLCYLQGLSRDEAAHQLGCSPGTLKNRLEQARERLHQRLASRGLTLGGALAASLLGMQTGAVPAALSASAIKTATVFAADQATSVSANVAALAEGALHAMLMTKLKVVAQLTAVAILAASGAGWGTGALMQASQPSHHGRIFVQADDLPPVEGKLTRLESPLEGGGVPENVLLMVKPKVIIFDEENIQPVATPKTLRDEQDEIRKEEENIRRIRNPRILRDERDEIRKNGGTIPSCSQV